MEQLHHALELAEDRLGAVAPALGGRVRGVRREEVERVVAPVVRETVLQQPRLGDERMDREQFDRRDSEREEVLDHRRVGEAGVRPVQRSRHTGMPLRQPLQMALVDDRAIHRHGGLANAVPVERALDGDGAPVVVAAADEAARIGLDEEAAAVEGVSGRMGAVDADGVARAGVQERGRHRPDTAGCRLESDAVGDPVQVGIVEHHELERVGAARPHTQSAAIRSEPDAQIIEIGAEQGRCRSCQSERLRAGHAFYSSNAVSRGGYGGTEASGVIYLDHAATSPLRPEARDAWLTATEALVGNASSIHGAGQAARRVLEDARERLAAVLDCDPVEVVFTSGGTESVNLGITGLYRARRETTGRTAIVAPTAEHHATIDTLAWLHAHDVAEIEWVPVDRDARVDLDAWQSAVESGDAAVATMLAANNEIGTLQPIVAAASACASAGVPLHVDAVGAFGHVPISFRGIRGESGSRGGGLVALSVAAHKLGGPVGIGALVVAREAKVEPLVHGGGQQRGIRSGTQDPAGAAAFAVAAELAVAELASEAARVRALRDRLERELRAALPDARISAASGRAAARSHAPHPSRRAG